MASLILLLSLNTGSWYFDLNVCYHDERKGGHQGPQPALKVPIIELHSYSTANHIKSIPNLEAPSLLEECSG